MLNKLQIHVAACYRVDHILLLTKNSTTFPGFFMTPSLFPSQDSVNHNPAMTNSSYLLHIYSVTVQSIAERSSQVAKKLFG